MPKVLFSLSVFALLALTSCGGGGGSDPTGPGGGGGGGTNHAPTVNVNASTTHLSIGGTATITAVGADPDGDQLTYGYSATRGTISSSGPTATTATFTAGTQFGAATAKATVTDGQGGSAEATATMYVRNPNPPRFTFGSTGSATCGYGTTRPDGFVLTITPDEAVTITSITVRPRSCTNNCTTSRTYATPLSLPAGQAYTWSEGGCLLAACCQSYGCGGCEYWTLYISGTRPEPDGGSFTFQCNSWNPSYPASSCN